MGTVETRRTAEACVFEGGVVAMAAYESHGKTVYKVCLTEAEMVDLQTSPYVDPNTIVWHYKDGEWLIPPGDDEEDEGEFVNALDEQLRNAGSRPGH